MNVKIKIAYDGGNYHGFQIQPNGITIQEVLEKALFSITGEEIRVIGCGRTDSGVHALGYICNFRTNARMSAEKYVPALNTKLPADIRCIEACEAEEDFHAKNSAVKKTYLYRIYNGAVGNVFERNYSWHFKYFLDAEKMNEAAKLFVGKHNFIGFASSGFTVKTTVREIYSASVKRNGDIIEFEITGNGFLYNMVRIIAGTLCDVGTGKIEVNDIADIINSRERTRAGITAPPQGLFMKEIFYA